MMTTVIDVKHPCPPGWLKAWVNVVPATAKGVSIWPGAAMSFVQVVVAGVRSLDDRQLQHAAADAYRRAFGAIDAQRHPHLWRCWQYLPGIERADAGLDRYMWFNRGRYAAMIERFGEPGLDLHLPAGTAVGSDGDELILHVLAGAEVPRAIENPRQIPAYRYSPTYGPRPPCFARGTIVPAILDADSCATLMVAGTASVVGEQSRHIGDLNAQLAELIENLRVVGRTATATAAASNVRWRELRAYIVEPDSHDAVTHALATAFPEANCIELLHARLCRSDLLVEVEAVADLVRQPALT